MLTEKEAMSQPAKATPHSPTPTPWMVGPEYYDNPKGDMRAGYVGSFADTAHSTFRCARPGDAAFIVRAVNSHAALQAENAEQREALQSIKARVCGEMTNGWKDQWDTTNSRGAIADICDKALTEVKHG